MEMAIRTEDVCKDDLLLPYGEVQKRWIWQGKACSNSTQLYVLWELVTFHVNRSDFCRPKSMFVQYIFFCISVVGCGWFEGCCRVCVQKDDLPLYA